MAQSPPRRERLNKTTVEAIVPDPGRDVVVWDTRQPGLHLRVTPGGRRTYYLYYRGRDGRQRRPKLGEHGDVTPHEARSIAHGLLLDARAGRDVHAQRRATITLASLWQRYSHDQLRRWKPTTARRQEILWRRIIAPALGHLRVHSITRADVAALLRAHEQTPTSANRAIALLRAMFNRAADLELHPGPNPCARHRLYPERRRELYLAGIQIAVLLDTITTMQEAREISRPVAGLLRLLMFTGARLGELLTLEWDLVQPGGGAIRLPDSKTGAKTIWLNAPARAELDALRAVRRQTRWVIEGRLYGRPLVNPQRPWHRVRTRAAETLEAGCRKHNLPTTPAEQLRNVRLHDLRHTYASLGVADGVPIYTMARTLGHASSTTTERYAHVADDPARDAAERIGRAILAATNAPAARVILLDEEGAEKTKSEAKQG